LEAVKQDLEDAKMAAKEQEELMAERLRVMYMDKNTSYLELLFESKSLNDFFVKLDMIKQMIAYDNQVLQDMNKTREDIEQKKRDCEYKTRDIELRKTQIEDKKAYLEQKKREINNERTLVSRQKASIETDQQEKERLLKELEKEKARISKELDELERLSKELEKKIKELTEKSKEIYAGGIMAWPAPGYSHISSDYGYRIHPITKKYKMHTGIDIAGSNIYGKSAIAAADGVVILAQYYRGYGNTVIIDHGSGITTLYAHGSAIKVRVGQKVKKGDPVLAIGSTGNSNGPHLHFEVRINGAHTSPWPYLRGK
ncbi:MAG TPA: peptidoglycan DD-metalloendopeptidase family protein, partial [Candidatus Atribacteria bacterium]|nr:peptidoglycan DD-metalloendopeptidase family protein [Candidatus Atribacteria bacterium]